MNNILFVSILAITVIALACDKRNESQNLASLKKSEELKQEIISDYEKSDDKMFQQGEEGFQGSSNDSQSKDEKEKKYFYQQPSNSNPEWDKKIIKVASLNLEVKNYYTFYSLIREKVRSLGGYISQEEQNQSNYKIENSLTIKIPVDQFDNALVQLTNSAEKINVKKISSQDVTTEVIDTKSRIETKKQTRLRYLDLLKQAKNMEEILSVQSEINEIQEEIESAAGRIEYLDHSSAFSSINLTYYQVLNLSAKNTDNPSFGLKLISAFKSGWSWVGELFVGLVSIWPLFLFGFISFIIYKKTRLPKPGKA